MRSRRPGWGRPVGGRRRSTVLFGRNLPGNQPLRAAVEQRTGLPVVVENDANAPAWSETRFGPAT